MKVVFDKEFFKVYAADPAAEEDRLEPIIEKIWIEFDQGTIEEDELKNLDLKKYLLK